MSYSIGAVRLKLKVLADKVGGQRNLGKLTGVDHGFISRVITGKKAPTDRLLKAVGLKRYVIYISRSEKELR